MKAVLRNELKNCWRKAKLLAGDHRGMKNRFTIAQQLDVQPLQVYYDAMGGGREGRRVEVEACFDKDDAYVYSMKDLINEVKEYYTEGEAVIITFTSKEYDKLGINVIKERLLFVLETTKL